MIVIDRVDERPTDPANSGEKVFPGELQFEAASVRPSRPDVHDGFSGSTPGGGFEARAETMRNLFATAWDISNVTFASPFSSKPQLADLATLGGDLDSVAAEHSDDSMSNLEAHWFSFLQRQRAGASEFSVLAWNF